MKLFYLFILLFCCSMIYITPSYADRSCQNPITPYDQTYCKAKQFLESDTALNETYSRLIDSLSISQRNQLVGEQRKWIKSRNRMCFNHGNIDLECNIKLNKSRLVFLKQRMRQVTTHSSVSYGQPTASNEIQPRRKRFDDCGYRNTYPREGWYDAQGQGVANDYCRYVGNFPQERGSPNNWFSCALAGETSPYSDREQYTDTSEWINTYEPLRPGDLCYAE